MAAPLLAGLDELMARLSTDVPADRATKALADASAAVRSYTGQQFHRCTSSELLHARGDGFVRLPQRPVNEVIAVAAATGTALTWDRHGPDTLRLRHVGGVGTVAHPHVSVTYDHGYDHGRIPDDIVLVVCNTAGRALAVPAEAAGITQETIVGYSASFGPVGASGPAGFFRGELEILDRYRRQVGATTVQSR